MRVSRTLVFSLEDLPARRCAWNAALRRRADFRSLRKWPRGGERSSCRPFVLTGVDETKATANEERISAALRGSYSLARITWPLCCRMEENSFAFIRISSALIPFPG